MPESKTVEVITMFQKAIQSFEKEIEGLLGSEQNTNENGGIEAVKEFALLREAYTQVITDYKQRNMVEKRGAIKMVWVSVTN